jgi:DNA repair exonuclease SbcCD ATPase subunit
MASKDELQSSLKERFSINKNISQPLTKEECERLIKLLESEPSAVKLVDSYASKNSTLGHNNSSYARARNQAERKFEALQTEYLQLEKSIESIELAKINLENKKKLLEEEQRKLKDEVGNLTSNNQLLVSKVQTLTTQNDEIADANAKLMKENRDLNNIVNQIKLRLARDTKALLQYEDNEIRKALIRLFRWTLG